VYVVSEGQVLLVGLLAGRTGDGYIVVVPNEAIRASFELLNGRPLALAPA
jgi:hypothetical protein